MSFLGIDIGSSHTKIVEIHDDGTIFHLVKFALFPSAELFEAMQDPSFERSKPATSYFKKMLSDAGFSTNKAYLTLPDYKIVTKVINMPFLKDQKSIQQAIEFTAEDHLPQPLSEMSLKYTVLNENLYDPKKMHEGGILSKSIGFNTQDQKGTMDVLIVAAPQKLIENYVYLAHKVGLEVVGLEPNSLTASRVIPKAQQSVPTILLNIGDSYSDISLVVNGNVRFIRNIKFGVSTLVRKLIEDLNLASSQSESYLFTYGFNPNHLNGKIKEILEPVMAVLVQETLRFQEYVEQRINFVKPGDPNKIRRLVVSGGGSLIPNIIVYMIGQLNLEVQYSDPWKVVNIDLVEEKDMLKILGPIFTSSVGAVIKLN